MLNLLADIFGITIFQKLYLRALAYRIHRRAETKHCAHCQHVLGTKPHVYNSHSAKLGATLRTPCVVADFRCSACGATSQFCCADNEKLSPIQPNAIPSAVQAK